MVLRIFKVIATSNFLTTAPN